MNVFDWEGNAKLQYLIKNTAVIDLAIDTMNQKIYGFSYENETHDMLEFDM